MKYVIGIDGGGTKTHCIIADENKAQLYECFGAPSNFLMIGTEQVSATIFSLIQQCKEKISINYNQIEMILIGTTGAGRRNDAQSLETDFRQYCQKKNQTFKNFVVESDALIALEGAFSGNPGSILISGTGSIMYGKDTKDRLVRVGGFGRFIGDEGSGYSLGKKGLIAASKSYDGRGTQTLITNLLKKEFSITTPDDLITEIYKNSFDIASVAPVVIQAAEQGDSQALKIIDEETNELVNHIETMHRKILVQNLDVAFIGSLIQTENIYSRILREKIKQQLTDVTIKSSENSPAFGAIMLAFKKLAN